MKEEQLLMDLTDEQCEKVVGGVGIKGGPNDGGAGAGTRAWFGNGMGPQDPSDNGLTRAGFIAPGGEIMAGPNTIGVPGPKG